VAVSVPLSSEMKTEVRPQSCGVVAVLEYCVQVDGPAQLHPSVKRDHFAGHPVGLEQEDDRASDLLRSSDSMKWNPEEPFRDLRVIEDPLSHPSVRGPGLNAVDEDAEFCDLVRRNTGELTGGRL
jgi:hypothetical protein